MIAIIDYDAGNLRSVQKALERVGAKTVITRSSNVILSADKVVLPGVGDFGDAMRNLHAFGLSPVLEEVKQKNIPLLGICVGLQLFFEDSEESPGAAGLGLLPGHILKIPEAEGLKVPHMGWNSLEINPVSKLLKDVPYGSHVYFVHSYYPKASDKSIVMATSEYGVIIDAVVEQGNVFACQFHPEKSSDVGMQILKNFVEMS